MKTFDKPGIENTEECCKLAYERAKELGLKEVVLASNSGYTTDIALKHFKGFKIISVTHVAGFKEPFKCEMPDEKRNELESKGVKVLTTTHAMRGIERALKDKSKGMRHGELIADTLRRFSQGTKVCVEVALMAADAGHLSGDDIVTIGGTGRGADTAIILKPANAARFYDLNVHEIICMPW